MGILNSFNCKYSDFSRHSLYNYQYYVYFFYSF